MAPLHLQALKTEWLRQRANEMAYVDPALSNRDAMLVGRLNTHMPGRLAQSSPRCRKAASTKIARFQEGSKPPELAHARSGCQLGEQEVEDTGGASVETQQCGG